MTFRAATPGQTRALGERLGALLRVGDVVGLVGPLGSGKTTFAQGLARGLAVPADRRVASPTFALVNEHPGRVPFVHADLYRVNNAAELAELGLFEACERAAVAIEWLDRFPAVAPADRIELRFEIDDGGGRSLALAVSGPRSHELVSALGLGSASPAHRDNR